MSTMTETLHALLSSVDMLTGRYQLAAEREASLRASLAAAETQETLLGLSHGALDTLLTVISQEALGSVEQLVTYGLQVVFPDKALRFRLQVETKRGVQWVEPTLIDGQVEAPILDAFGGGPAAVASFLLRVMVCRRLKLAPVILLDEPFSFVSAEYVPNVAKLLRELADAAGMTFVMVTHDPTFIESATRAYEARVTAAHGTTFVEVTP